ncbi:hypothetical protein [Hyalangium versicolor]|uniref:hypothetical protein n=1 Tax=Hyalangium versicolor TaxID=2861190 RepID=UPI001CC990A8|nr:hypothetical protein [Hyalangium versicolor]
MKRIFTKVAEGDGRPPEFVGHEPGATRGLVGPVVFKGHPSTGHFYFDGSRLVQVRVELATAYDKDSLVEGHHALFDTLANEFGQAIRTVYKDFFWQTLASEILLHLYAREKDVGLAVTFMKRKGYDLLGKPAFEGYGKALWLMTSHDVGGLYEIERGRGTSMQIAHVDSQFFKRRVQCCFDFREGLLQGVRESVESPSREEAHTVARECAEELAKIYGTPMRHESYANEPVWKWETFESLINLMVIPGESGAKWTIQASFTSLALDYGWSY